MSSPPNTLFLRLEAPLQAWGSNEAKFAVRRTADAPTKSGVAGLLCAALGISRAEAGQYWLGEIAKLRMGVRIDRPGIRWWDYHTVGAEQKLRISDLKMPNGLVLVGTALAKNLGADKIKSKPGALLSRREYLADASFLVALQGEPDIVAQLAEALKKPAWTLYLGRKSCPPSRTVDEHPPGFYASLKEALRSIPAQLREKGEPIPDSVPCVLDWVPAHDDVHAPPDAEAHYDVPVSFEPPHHLPRLVIRCNLPLDRNFEAETVLSGKAWQPPRNRAYYDNPEYKRVRAERLVMDNAACMFCKAPATTVQHVNYRRAGGSEKPEDLRALCRLCHDACTMLEYGSGMTMDRIDPCDPAWRERILAKREEIIKFRSLEQRRRKLDPKEENG